MVRSIKSENCAKLTRGGDLEMPGDMSNKHSESSDISYGKIQIKLVKEINSNMTGYRGYVKYIH